MMEYRKKDEKKDKIREEDKGEEINKMHNNKSELGQRVRKE